MTFQRKYKLFEKARIRNLLGPQIPADQYKLGQTTRDLLFNVESGISSERMNFRGEPMEYNREKKRWFFVSNPQN